MDAPTCAIGGLLASSLRAARNDLARRWLDRIAARVAITPGAVFPTEDLLDHVPLLIDGIADYLERPEADIDDDVPVVAKARELGAMRHRQGFDAYQILKEYHLLTSIILVFLEETVDSIAEPPSPRELIACLRRAAEGLEIIRQATTTHFLQLSTDRINEREERLRRFNRGVAHELRNSVSAIRGGAGLLEESWLTLDERARFRRMVIDNAESLHRVLENLEALSRLEADTRQHRNVLLPSAAAEAARILRTAADSRGVDVRVASDLPQIEVNAAAVELCLANYISNAIKYSDPTRRDRWVEVTAEFSPGTASGETRELIVRVRDNGIGVPPDARGKLFQHFFRAHSGTVTEVEGTGLGLSIVRETAQALGGRAWAEFPDEGGAIFAFSLPAGRADDAEAAGAVRAPALPSQPPVVSDPT